MATIPPGKRALFYAILALVAYALVEAASFAFHYGTVRKVFSLAETRAERQAIVNAIEGAQAKEFGALAVGNPPGSIYEVLHPYLGFVQDPMRTPGYSEYGFPDADVRLYAKDPKRVVIGIFGGSFADGFARTSKEVLIAALKKSPRFAGKEIKVLAVSMGGYKQPQQLLSLAWLISLGAHFDVVVNLDGLNEVALPVTDNIPKGVSPFYPRNWSGRMNSFDATMLAFAREHAGLVEDRKGWARLFSRAPLRYSITAGVVWVARDRMLENRINGVNVAAQKYRPTENTAGYMVRGPRFAYADEAATYDDLARMWKSASLQMKTLAAANGMNYLHFLQPNQYVPGSKELGAEERKAAYDEAHPYRKSVLVGYPKLQERGKELRQQGVSFVDLTMSLAGHREALYIDTCCHLSHAGYAILASTIADGIVKQP